jgi:hypothetical protein
MHTNEKAIDKLTKSFRKEDYASLRDMIIYQDPDGSYNLYESYNIQKKDGYCIVNSTTLAKSISFTNLRNAVTWCNFDKRNKVADSKRILELDAKIAGVETDIQLQLKLVKTAKDTESKLIHLAKLGEVRLKKTHMLREMSSYIENSMSWQIGKFTKKTEQ